MCKIRNKSVCFYAFAAICMFFVMVRYSGLQEFWYDEVYQIGLIRGDMTPGQVLSEYAKLKDYTPPLYAMLAYYWMKAVPFSFRWLLLLSEGFTAVGVFFTAWAAERTAGKKAGLFAALTAVSSSVLILKAGYEFRSYSLYFAASAAVLFALGRRLSRPGLKSGVYYGLALAVLLYSHYYGCVIAGMLFLLDAAFVLFHKKKAVSLLSYGISGACFAPWIIAVFLNHTRSMTEFWIQPPDMQALFKLADYLCSGSELTLFLLGIGLGVCVCSVLAFVQKRCAPDGGDEMAVYVLFVIVGVVASMYLYGAVINPSGGIFYNRYFLGLLPWCFWVMAKGMSAVLNLALFQNAHAKKVTAVLAAGIFFLLIVHNGNMWMTQVKDGLRISYTASAEALSRKKDIETPGVLVVTSDNSHVRAGIECYLEQFYGAKADVVSQHDGDFPERVQKAEKIYLFRGKQPWTDTEKQLLSPYRRAGSDKKTRISEYIR